MKTKAFLFGIPVVLIITIGGLSAYTSVTPITSCEPIGNARPLCGWQNPEDMAVLPDGRYVVVSEYGGQNGAQTGALALLDSATETRQLLYAGGDIDQQPSWGTDDCSTPPGAAFSPHGIHLSQRQDGALQLLVVQHGGRESVEMFEVRESAENTKLIWRGCVIAPAENMFNDVVATPDGGFLATHWMTPGQSAPAMFVEFLRGSLLGADTGYVLSWQPDAGFGRLESSWGGVPNGIEISADGETVFVNYSANGEVRRINRRLDQVEASNDALPPLDNATWAPDGRLLVAGAVDGPLKMMGCSNLQEGSCPGAYAIWAVDPETLESVKVYEGGPGTPGGAGTVGLQLRDGSLLIGTFAGDRIVRVALRQNAMEME